MFQLIASLLGGGAAGGGAMSGLMKLLGVQGAAGAGSSMGPFGMVGGGNPIHAAFSGGPPSGTSATGYRPSFGNVAQNGPGRGFFGNQVPGQQGGSYGSTYTASAPPDNTVGGSFTGPNGNNVGKGGPGATPGAQPGPNPSMKDQIMQAFLKNLFGNVGKPIPPGHYQPASFMYSGGRPAMQNQGGY